MKQHPIPGFLLVGLLLSGIGHAVDRPYESERVGSDLTPKGTIAEYVCQ